MRKYILVMVINCAMALISNDQIIVTGRELRVNLHHAGVGREVNTRLVIDFASLDTRAMFMWKILFEFSHGLAYEFFTVCQEEYSLHPPGPHEYIHQANNCACFSRAGRHH